VKERDDKTIARGKKREKTKKLPHDHEVTLKPLPKKKPKQKGTGQEAKDY